MTQNHAHSLTRIDVDRPLAVRLFKDRGAPPLAHEPVRPADLTDAASEAWRDGCLRAGHPDAPLSDVPMRLSPILAEGPPERCLGFRLHVARPDGRTSVRFFTIHSLRHVADRAAAPLIEADLLKPGEPYHFEVVVDTQGPASGAGSEDGVAVTLSLRSGALAYLRAPLRPLIERATPVALQDEELPPVFYTKEALAKAESCARRGAGAAVETGGALFGSLAVCPESGEFFAVVHDVIGIEDAEESKFSLSYSSRSWLRLREIQKARQAAYPRRADRLLGQVHGHPFLPNGGKVCADCLQRPTCTLSSAWASEDDQTWHRAVFTRQPWALCHIFGLSARGEPVHQLFGLKDARLQARGFYLLPDFEFPSDG